MKVIPLDMPPQTAKVRSRPWYQFWIHVIQMMTVLLFRFKYRGSKWVPPTGGFLIASNHVSFLDPLLVGIACHPREIHYFARKDLFDIPVLNWWMSSVNAIPIARAQADIAGFREALRLLGNGNALLVFPEGTRSHDGGLQEPLAGVGMIVARAGVPVVPARVFGVEKAWPRHAKFPRLAAVSATVGQPIRFELTPEESKSRETYQAISREIMRRIAELET